MKTTPEERTMLKRFAEINGFSGPVTCGTILAMLDDYQDWKAHAEKVLAGRGREMNVCLSNCINNLRKDGKGRKFLVQEMYGNLVEMIARVKMGDMAALDEFVALYCMEGDVKQWREKKEVSHANQ